MTRLVPTAQMTLGPFFPREFAAGASDLTQLDGKRAQGEVIEITGRVVQLDGRPLDLTPTEFRLLTVLMERRGRVQSRTQLLEAVWEVTARITTRTVDMHVQRLRTKLGPHAPWVETARGFGYRFRSEPPAGTNLF